MAVRINSPWDLKLYNREKETARKKINSASDARHYFETYGGNGQSGNWNNITTNNAYSYNAITRKWEQASTKKTVNTTASTSSMSNSSGSSSSGGALSQTGVSNSGNSSTSSSRTSAEKDYIEVEFNTLTGSCKILPTKNSIKLKVGETVTLQGIGKYLSGLYFIAGITRTISESGYEMTLQLIRNGFGDSLKKAKANNTTTATKPKAKSANTAKKDTSKNVVNNSFKVGDKVKIVGNDAVYSNASDGVKVPDWVKKETLTIDGLSDDKKRARLTPIWSWTYVKFLKHI
jgi:hypothetical protein